ncbi:MAG: hypothetical protein CMO40_03055 [Verrucomicrobiaceae bacterium]|nr:hypothetical protein [Verrucomicrobiaceae bacterium]
MDVISEDKSGSPGKIRDFPKSRGGGPFPRARGGSEESRGTGGVKDPWAESSDGTVYARGLNFAKALPCYSQFQDRSLK